MYNSYFDSAANSGCECKNRNNERPPEKHCEKSPEIFHERCFEMRNEDSALQIQLINGKALTIPIGGVVKFDSIVDNFTRGIKYTESNGIVTLKKPGVYTINWQMDTTSAGTATEVDFSIYVNGVNYATGSSPLVEGQVSGTAIVRVCDDPVTVQLINTTGTAVVLASTVVQGNMVIAN